MAADSNDIANWFATLHDAANKLAGQDLPPEEQALVKKLAETALHIGESIVTDLNRIAYALEHHAYKG